MGLRPPEVHSTFGGVSEPMDARVPKIPSVVPNKPLDEIPASVGTGVATTCIEHAYGSTFRLSFQIKVF